MVSLHRSSADGSENVSGYFLWKRPVNGSAKTGRTENEPPGKRRVSVLPEQEVKKYTFDIEKYLNRRMRLKAEDEYEVISV